MLYVLTVLLAGLAPMALAVYASMVVPGRVRTAIAVAVAFAWCVIELITIAVIVANANLFIAEVHIVLMLIAVAQSRRQIYLHCLFAVMWPTEAAKQLPVASDDLHMLVGKLRDAYPKARVHTVTTIDGRQDLRMNGRLIITLRSLGRSGG